MLTQISNMKTLHWLLQPTVFLNIQRQDQEHNRIKEVRVKFKYTSSKVFASNPFLAKIILPLVTIHSLNIFSKFINRY